MWRMTGLTRSGRKANQHWLSYSCKTEVFLLVNTRLCWFTVVHGMVGLFFASSSMHASRSMAIRTVLWERGQNELEAAASCIVNLKTVATATALLRCASCHPPTHICPRAKVYSMQQHVNLSKFTSARTGRCSTTVAFSKFWAPYGNPQQKPKERSMVRRIMCFENQPSNLPGLSCFCCPLSPSFAHLGSSHV